MRLVIIKSGSQNRVGIKTPHEKHVVVDVLLEAVGVSASTPTGRPIVSSYHIRLI